MPTGQSRAWTDAILELGSVVCRTTTRWDEAPCPSREHCHAYETGDFTAPDVPTQPDFEGSRRQFHGRVVRALSNDDELAVDDLGPRVRVDYAPDGDRGREWLLDLLSDLADDGLVEVRRDGGDVSVRLSR